MKREQFEYHEEAIWKWRLLDDGALEKIGPVHTYNVRVGKIHTKYSLLYGETTHYFRADDLDVVTHGRYYSFDGDDKKATQAFAQYFQNRAASAYSEWQKAQNKYEEFLKKNKVFS